MSDREQFEAWHIEHVGRKPMLDTPSGHWVDDKKAFSAWQASRRAALEEANWTLSERGLFGAAELVRDLGDK